MWRRDRTGRRRHRPIPRHAYGRRTQRRHSRRRALQGKAALDPRSRDSSKGPALIDRVVKPDLVALGNRIAAIKTSGRIITTANLVPFSYYVNPGASISETSAECAF